jgi:hypothetical protein
VMKPKATESSAKPRRIRADRFRMAAIHGSVAICGKPGTGSASCV